MVVLLQQDGKGSLWESEDILLSFVWKIFHRMCVCDFITSSHSSSVSCRYPSKWQIPCAVTIWWRITTTDKLVYTHTRFLSLIIKWHRIRLLWGFHRNPRIFLDTAALHILLPGKYLLDYTHLCEGRMGASLASGPLEKNRLLFKGSHLDIWETRMFWLWEALPHKKGMKAHL